MQYIHIVLQGEIFYQGTAVLDNKYAARYSEENSDSLAHGLSSPQMP